MAQIAETSSGPSARLRLKSVVTVVFLVLPAIIFYTLLFRAAVNVPYGDDYDIALGFLNKMAELQNGSARLSYFFASQQNEYKLFFARFIAWLQLAIWGRIDVRLLCALGNGFILLLAILLWKMFLPKYRALDRRLTLFIPVVWVIFQLQYAETLNWAMPALANLSVIVFSLSTIYFLHQPGRLSFCWALMCLVLSVASLGNGLLMIPLGVLILVLDRHYARIVSWLIVSAGCIAAYAYRYDVMNSQTQHHRSILWTLLHPRVFYAIAFIGNAAALGAPVNIFLRGRYHSVNVFLSLLLGLVLCGFLAAGARRGYIRRNPLVSYCILYLLLTAIGVAGLRSDFGMGQSLSMRYRIYSALFLVFAWFVLVEEFVNNEISPPRRSHVLLIAIASAVVFSLSMDWWGYSYLVQRKREMVVGMAAFEHPVSPGSSSGPVLPIPGRNAAFDQLTLRAPAILRQSIKLGIYKPPAY